MRYRILPLLVWLAPVLVAQPPPQHLYPGHPRLVFRPPAERGLGRTFQDVRTLYRSDTFFHSVFQQALDTPPANLHPAMAASFWIVTGEERFAAEAVRLLLEGRITQSGSGAYSNVWSYALAWDWLYDHPLLAGDVRERAAARIAERLESELAQLDDNGMALWHGRNQAANGVMIAALALGDRPSQGANLRRATAHYTEAIRALNASEGWPEGPSYWIYNRALPYPLAVDCYLTATGAERIDGISLREVMRKIGLWSLYQYAPNGIFEPYGDSAGSLRLGETGIWEASVDYFAKLSRDAGVVAAASYFRSRSPLPYGKRPIQWYVALAYEPSTVIQPELWLRSHMPQSMLFGRDTLGVAFFRGDWGDANELYASFKAGDLLAHHDHYNVGHFSIQLGGLLAPLTGVYGASAYDGPYRLGYAVQTVASNSILILSPGEKLSGGQRVISPTGFNCVSLDHFRRNLNSGKHLERATITAYESIAGSGDYIAADITAAYNSTRFAEPGTEAKVSLVTRQFLYLRREQAFVVFDRVQTERPSFLPKFLLHSLSKPLSATEQLLAGTDADDGILQTSDRTLKTSDQRGVLTQIVLLPERARTLKIGGPHFNGYVENGGVNLQPDPGKGTNSPKPIGLWRTEVEPTAEGTHHRFLNVLLPRLASDSRKLPEVELLKTEEAIVAVRTGGSVAVFARNQKYLGRLEMETTDDLECWVVDARPGATYQLKNNNFRATAEGVLKLTWPRGRQVLSRRN